MRAICGPMVLIYHFFAEITWNYPAWDTEFAGRVISISAFDLGTLAVFVFFLLSGASLAYTRPSFSSVKDIKNFYRSRFLRIYPMYWLVFFYQYIWLALANHNLLYDGPVKYLLGGILGINSYVFYTESRYTLAGDWFIGALILIYLLYPLLANLHKHKNTRYIVLGVLLGMTIVVSHTNLFQIFYIRNLFTCLFTFYLGMMFMDYRKKITSLPHIGWISFGIFMLFGYVLPSSLGLFSDYVTAVSFFVLLYTIAPLIQKKAAVLWNIVLFLSAVSYPLFLIQHTLDIEILSYFSDITQFGVKRELLLCALILLLGIVFAWILQNVNTVVMKAFKRN